MGTTETAGATAPATRHVKLDAIEFDVNPDAVASWAFFDGMRHMADEGVGGVGRFELSLRLIEMATGLTERQIVDAAGGDTAPATDVMRLVAEIYKETTSKN